MLPINALGLGFLGITTLLILVWFVQLLTRNAGLVDAVWSAALGLSGVLYACLGDAPIVIRVLLALMTGLWGLRLAAHLAWRMRGQAEDSRYAAARSAWGRRADLYLLLFFLFQAIVAWILSLPFLVVAYMPSSTSLWLVIGAVLIWLTGIGGEALADAQLQRFKKNPANRDRVCDGGLWRYSRHPNYFFESIHWLSYVVLAIGSPFWWVTLAGPIIMTTLLLKVSGIPTIEQRPAQAQRAGYAAYVHRTSAFIPWPPRNDGG